jgi:hypothetical protein
MCCAYVPRGASPVPFPSPFSIGDVSCADPFAGLESLGSLCDPFSIGDLKEISTHPAGGRGAKGNASRSNTLDTDAILGSIDFTLMKTTVHVFDGETAVDAHSSVPLEVSYIDCGEMTTLRRVVDAMPRSSDAVHAHESSIPVVFVSSTTKLPTHGACIEEIDGYVRIHARIPSLRMRAVYAFRVVVRPDVSCMVIVPRFEHAMLRFAANDICFECTTAPGDGCPGGEGVCAYVTLTKYAFDTLWQPADTVPDETRLLLARTSLCMENAPSSLTRESIREIIDSSSSEEETKLVAKTAVALIPQHKLGLIKTDVTRALECGKNALTNWTNAFSKMFVL